MDFDAKIPRTHLTIREIVDILQNSENAEKLGWRELAGAQGQNIKSVDVENLSGKGYASVVSQIIFKFIDTERQFSTVLKYPTVEILAPKDGADTETNAYFLSLLRNCHRCEVHFYTKIADKFLQNLQFIPKIFGWKDCSKGGDKLDGAFLLMEDFCGRAVHNEPESRGFTKEQMESLIEKLAEFHANSAKIPPELIEQQYHMTRSHFQKNVDKTLEAMCRFPAPYGQYWQQNLATLRNFLEHTEPAGAEFNYKIAKKYGFSPKLLTHGDVWTNNLLFIKNADGSAGDQLAALLDWQCVHPGTGLNDVARLWNVDAPLRKQHEPEWLALYRAKFEQYSNDTVYSAGGTVIPRPISHPLACPDTVRAIYDEQFRAALHTLMVMECMLVDRPEHAQLREVYCQRMRDAFEQILAPK